MNILVQPNKPSEASTGWRAVPEQRLLLHNVSWASYVAIGAALTDHPALRMTFDRGRLEFMTTSQRHEVYKKWLGRIVETLAEECQLALAPAGNMTFQRPDLERGLEPDDCYWITNEPRMRGRLDYDPERDPPPDLVVEIEVSRSALDRMSIYAALGVPEVWRFDGAVLHIELLQPDRVYQSATNSLSFPNLAVAELTRFLEPSQTVDYLSVIRQVRAWAQQQRSQSSG